MKPASAVIFPLFCMDDNVIILLSKSTLTLKSAGFSINCDFLLSIYFVRYGRKSLFLRVEMGQA